MVEHLLSINFSNSPLDKKVEQNKESKANTNFKYNINLKNKSREFKISNNIGVGAEKTACVFLYTILIEETSSFDFLSKRRVFLLYLLNYFINKMLHTLVSCIDYFI